MDFQPFFQFFFKIFPKITQNSFLHPNFGALSANLGSVSARTAVSTDFLKKIAKKIQFLCENRAPKYLKSSWTILGMSIAQSQLRRDRLVQTRFLWKWKTLIAKIVAKNLASFMLFGYELAMSWLWVGYEVAMRWLWGGYINAITEFVAFFGNFRVS